MKADERREEKGELLFFFWPVDRFLRSFILSASLGKNEKSSDPAHLNIFDKNLRQKRLCRQTYWLILITRHGTADESWHFNFLNYSFLSFTVDTPDPYLMMRIPTSPEMVKRTKCVSNNKNPVWKEEPFVFHIDPEQENVLGW